MSENKNSSSLLKLVELYNKSYPKLEETYKSSNKPIVLVGPKNCGKNYSVMQLCRDNFVVFYSSSKIADDNELFGYIGSDNTYQKTPLFDAYLNGELFYLDDLLSCPTSVLKKLLEIQNSEEYNFPCGKVERGKNFRIIISVDKSTIKSSEKLLEKFEVINFSFDSKVEAHLCPNRELFYFLNGLRSLAPEIDLNITTSTFEKLYKMKNISSFEPIDIVKCVISGENKTYAIKKIIDKLEVKLAKNSFFVLLEKLLKKNS